MNLSFEKMKKESKIWRDLTLAVSKKDIEVIHSEKILHLLIKHNLEILIKGLTTIPDDFNGHPKLSKFLESRKKLLDGSGKADWAFAESLALEVFYLTDHQ